MKADLAKREPDMLNYWRELDLYNRQRREFAGRPKFVLHAMALPTPTVPFTSATPSIKF